MERPGAVDGTGLVRLVKVALSTVREEITDVGPGHVIRYRMIKGAPVATTTVAWRSRSYPAAAHWCLGTHGSAPTAIIAPQMITDVSSPGAQSLIVRFNPVAGGALLEV